MRTHDRSVDAAGAKRLKLVALAVVAALVCLSLRVVRLPEREAGTVETRGGAAVVAIPPVVVTSR